MLVHPDKNMGSPLASESFKKLQCASEVLSNSTKKRHYDEQLRKEEYKSQKSPDSPRQDRSNYCYEESRCIQCRKCGNSHIRVCTNRTKTKARWCQDCCQYHQAKDGDGWLEYRGSLVFDSFKILINLLEVPRAFVCAESRIFDVSEWAICQGMACRPNTHRPSFHVNMVGSSSSRYPWDLDAEMMDEDEEFDIWLQQALASGLFVRPPNAERAGVPLSCHKRKERNIGDDHHECQRKTTVTDEPQPAPIPSTPAEKRVVEKISPNKISLTNGTDGFIDELGRRSSRGRD